MSIKHKLAAALAALCLAAPAYAQKVPGKTLLIIRDYDDVWSLEMALSHAIQLKRAGADVRVLFQDEAVLALLYFPLPVPADAELAGQRRQDQVDLYEERPFPSHDYRSQTSGKLPLGNRRGREAKLKYAGKALSPAALANATLAEFKALKIPYEVSAQSAAVYGVLIELKAKGEPLTAGSARPPDISAHVKAGYKVSVF